MDNVKILHIISLVEAYGAKNYLEGSYHVKGQKERASQNRADAEHVFKQIKLWLNEEKDK